MRLPLTNLGTAEDLEISQKGNLCRPVLVKN